MRRPARLLFCALVALALFAAGCAKDPAEEEGGGIREKTSGGSVAVEVNSLAPAFAANLLGGGEIRLSDYVGNHVVLLEFWSIFCKSCIEEMPRIHELHQKYAGEGLAVMSVNTDVFSDARVRQTLDKAGVKLDYPILRDVRRTISNAYNVELLPVTVIIDRSGWIRLYQEGYAPGDEEKFEALIRKLLRTEQKEDVTLASKGGVTSFAPTGSSALVKEGAAVKPVDKAPLDGQKIAIGAGKPTALFFWSLYCRPCRAEFPSLAELHSRFAARGIQVCSVNVDSERFAPRVRKFLEPYPAIPCLPDWPEHKDVMLSRLLGVTATPAVVVLDARGNVVLSAQGQVDGKKLEERLLSLVK